MNPSDFQPARDPREQWLRYLDGTFPAEDVAQVNDQLQADSSLRHEFAELLLLQVQLGEIGREVQPSRASRMDLTAGGGRSVPSADRISRVAPAVSDRRRETMPSRRRAGPQRSLVSWSIALAASVTLLAGLGVWFFGPTTGEPVLAQVRGDDTSIERGTESIPASAGIRLQPTDVLRTGPNGAATISFAPEKTQITIRPGTEFKLVSVSGAKRFALDAGKIEAAVARQRPFRLMVIVTPQAEARVLGTQFTLEVDSNISHLEVMEGKVAFKSASDGKKVKVTAGQWAFAGTNVDLVAALPATGKILYEYWTNFPDINNFWWESVSEDPSVVEYPARFEAPSHAGSNFLARIRGYVYPPKTGDYTFWLAGDSGCQFLLSPDDQPENKVSIATANNTKRREWTGEINLQQSSSITLIAGRKYYIEAVQKYSIEAAQNPTDDEHHLAVAWQGPDRQREVIPGEFLSPFEAKRKKGK